MSQDNYFYNLENGFDKWQNDTSGNYLYIPFISGTTTSIKGREDTITGYTWIGKYIQDGKSILPFEGRYQFSNNSDLIKADNGHSYLYSLTDSAMAKLDYAELFGFEPYNNLIVNGRFADGTYLITGTSGGTVSITSSDLCVTGDGSNSATLTYMQFGFSLTTGRKYYSTIQYKVDNSDATRISHYFRDGVGGTVYSEPIQNTPTANLYYRQSTIFTASTSAGNLLLQIKANYVDAATANNKSVCVDKSYGIQLYDLTAIYGAGNEPSSITADDLKYLAGYNIFLQDDLYKKSELIVYSNGLTDTLANKLQSVTTMSPAGWIEIPMTAGLMDFGITGADNLMWFFPDNTQSGADRPAKTIYNDGTIYVRCDDWTDSSIEVNDNGSNANYTGNLSDWAVLTKSLTFDGCTALEGNLSSASRLTDSLSLHGCTLIEGNLSSLSSLTGSLDLNGCTLVEGNLSSISSITSELDLNGCALVEGDMSILNISSYLDLNGCTEITGTLNASTSATYIDISNIGCSASELDATIANLVTAGEVNGTLIMTGLARTTDSDIDILILNTRGWTITDASGGGLNDLFMEFNIATDAETLAIPCQNAGTFNATIDWGDGSTSAITAYNEADLAHEYAVAGTYIVRINGTFPNIYFNNGGDKLKLLRVLNLGATGWTRLNNAFYGCSNLTSFGNIYCDTSNVTDMALMFAGCSGMTSCDVGNLNTAEVTNMSYLFYDCSGLTSLDVSGLNTAKNTNMAYMFGNCSGVTTLDVSGFDTAKVINMAYMFYTCSDLTALDVSGFDTAKTTNMGRMFNGCTNLSNVDISGFDIHLVTTGANFMSGSNSALSTAVYDAFLLSAYAQSSTGGGTGVVSSVPWHFGDAQFSINGEVEVARQSLIDNDGWVITDGGGVNQSDLFMEFNIATDAETLTIPCQNVGTFDATVYWGDGSSSAITAYNDADLAHEYTTAGTYIVRINGTFPNIYFNNGGDKLKLLRVLNLGDTGLTTLQNAFYGCDNLTAINNIYVDTTDVTDMSRLVYGCTSLVSTNISTANIQSVTTAEKFSDFLTTALTTANYDAFLNSAYLQSTTGGGSGVESDVRWHFGLSKHTASGTPKTSRESLIGNDGWIITDGSMMSIKVAAGRFNFSWNNPTSRLWTFPAGTVLHSDGTTPISTSTAEKPDVDIPVGGGIVTLETGSWSGNYSFNANNTNAVYVGDLADLPALTYYLSLGDCALVTGDLADLPALTYYLSLSGCTLVTGVYSAVTGTTVPTITTLTNTGLSAENMDDTLIAYAACTKTGGTFTATGMTRTAASDTAVAHLTDPTGSGGLGWTIIGITKV